MDLKKNHYRIAGLIVLLFLMIPNTVVMANDDGVRGATQSNLDEIRTRIAPDRTWTVKFNQAVLENTLEDNLFIADEAGNPLKVYFDLSDDRQSVVVKALSNYLCGQTYYLHILNGVCAQNGLGLNEAIRMPFRIMDKEERAGSFAITQVSAFKSNFTVSLTNLPNARYYNLFKNGTALSNRAVPVTGALANYPGMFSDTANLLVRFYSDSESQDLLSATVLQGTSLYIIR